MSWDIAPPRVIGAANVTMTVRLDDLYPESKQDLLDGAALRRLRAELPKEWSYQVTFDLLEFDDNTDFIVYAQHEDDEDPRASGYATTIAEAADKCTAKLKEIFG